MGKYRQAARRHVPPVECTAGGTSHRGVGELHTENNEAALAPRPDGYITLIIRVKRKQAAMRSKSFDGMVCPIAGALAEVGDRWSLIILRDLLAGIRRYDDFRRSSGVTNATLSDRLKHLETNGLIERHLYQASPDRYEYLPTAKGREVAALMLVLADLGDRWGVSGAPQPPLAFVNRKTGAAVRVALVDQETGLPLAVGNVMTKAGPGADESVRWRLSQSERPTVLVDSPAGRAGHKVGQSTT